MLKVERYTKPRTIKNTENRKVPSPIRILPVPSSLRTRSQSASGLHGAPLRYGRFFCFVAIVYKDTGNSEIRTRFALCYRETFFDVAYQRLCLSPEVAVDLTPATSILTPRPWTGPATSRSFPGATTAIAARTRVSRLPSPPAVGRSLRRSGRHRVRLRAPVRKQMIASRLLPLVRHRNEPPALTCGRFEEQPRTTPLARNGVQRLTQSLQHGRYRVRLDAKYSPADTGSVSITPDIAHSTPRLGSRSQQLCA